MLNNSKKTLTKLFLHKETLAQLDKYQLKHLKGGSTTGGCTSPSARTRPTK